MLHNNDVFVIKSIYDFIKNPSEIILVNHCCIYLQFLTLLEITKGGGEVILLNALSGKRNTTKLRSYSWPKQPNTTTDEWQIQKKIIWQVFCFSSNKIQQPLGPWISIPEKMWWSSPTQNSLYLRDVNIISNQNGGFLWNIKLMAKLKALSV